ncbi:MAG: hypothetical protein WC701_06765 [Kiritimatiellales bacterium]|jgi:hypothetical protein
MKRKKSCLIMSLLLTGFFARAVQTGENFTFKPAPADGDEMVWYLIDWGDGTLTPTSHGLADFSPDISKVWNVRGNYKIEPRAVTLSGKIIPLKGAKLSVTGSDLEKPAEIPADLFRLDSLDDSPRTGRTPEAADRPYVAQSIGLRFDKVCAVDTLVLKKHPDFPFPDSFSVEFSTDGGKIWNDVPAAAYNHFPDPGEKEIRIPLNGLAADAVRVTSYKPPEISAGQYALQLGGLRAEGADDLLFEMDADAQTAADWNNMWLVFGSAENEIRHYFVPYPWPSDRPDEGGMLMIGSTIWAQWNAMKLSWLDKPDAKKYFENTVSSYPQDEAGLMGVSPGGFFHLDHSKHYVTPAIFICGMSHWYLMHREKDFLQAKDKKGGATLLEKMRKAMKYQLEDMDGKSGVMTVQDPEHDGTAKGMSGNYWDGWRFGYKSAYENMLFYQSLDWMARLEAALGNADKAAEYTALRAKVKEEYNRVFWNEKTERFAGCIAKDGTVQDYGFTFVNLEAVASGIAAPEHAQKIFEWLNGDRAVYGDTSKREDIYFFKIAPRANTLAAEAVNPSFWDDWTMKVGPGTVGEYGTQIQNGGHIFYVSYYDLMSRLQTLGISDAMKRMQVILDEFHKDQLRRKPGNASGSTHLEGILREFPESGLVPLFFVTGILGIQPDAEGLRIAPALPDGWKFAGIREYWFAGKKYSIRVEKDRTEPEVNGSRVTVPAKGSWLLKTDGTIAP